MFDHSGIPWPDGARCAAAVTFDVDADSLLYLDDPLGGHRRVGYQSWLRYDLVAVPAILRMYRRLGLRQTFFFPGWCLERYPELGDAVAQGGHEIAPHGYLHEIAHELEPDQERELMERSIELARTALGRAPSGWRGPRYTFSDRTAELIAACGLSYHSGLLHHHLPHRIATPAGSFYELPVERANDDWPQYVVSPDYGYFIPIRAPDHAFATFRAEFEAAYQSGGLWIGVWHPFVSGRPSRLDAVERFLEELIARGDVWLAPLEDISAHLGYVEATGAWVPETVALPFDPDPPSLYWPGGGL
ncbi:MAG TPA: polysaccharide deacetylase family protein [Solirubrobacteraceae bacterium]|nr:polysaccharide deacetylase family protein [Solirubrobacteraceae bacterium]